MGGRHRPVGTGTEVVEPDRVRGRERGVGAFAGIW
jgi:hypothetical protein